jgi:hypothetical protein
MGDALIESILGRLRDQVEPLRLVAGAAGFAAASENNPPATPAAYVFLTGESGGESAFDTPTLQRLDQSLALVLVLRHAGAPAGAGAAADMASLSATVRTALRGFRPSPAHEPLRLQSASLLSFRDRHEWWQQTWQTATYEGV